MSRLGYLAKLIPDKRYDNDVKFVHTYVQQYVQKAVALRKASMDEEKSSDEGEKRYVFLNELAKTNQSEKKIQDELLNVLLAGRDTTAGLLSYLFYTLARRPDVFKKLRAEVLEVGNKMPTFEQIKGMKYLQYCLNESQSPLLIKCTHKVDMLQPSDSILSCPTTDGLRSRIQLYPAAVGLMGCHLSLSRLDSK